MKLFHVERHSGIWSDPDSRVLRIYWRVDRHQFRRCVLDFTKATVYVGKPPLVNLSVFGLRIRRGLDTVTRPKHRVTGKFLD